MQDWKRVVRDNWILAVAGIILLCLLIPTVYLYWIIGGLGTDISYGNQTAVIPRFAGNKPAVGLALNSLTEARWLREKELFNQEAARRGFELQVAAAENDPSRQVAQLEAFIEGGVEVLIVVPVNSHSLQPVLQKADTAGVTIISYDSLTSGPVDAYLGFDYRQLGRLQAQYLTEQLPDGGHIAIFNGPQDDYRSSLIQKGYDDGLQDSEVEVIASQFLPDWNASEAVVHLKRLLTRKKVDGILCASDCIAGQLADFFHTQRLPRLPLTGAGAEVAAGKRILAGEQSMTVFLDFRHLVKVTMDLAANLLAADDGKQGREVHAETLADLILESGGQTRKIAFQNREIPAAILPVRVLDRRNLYRVLISEEEFYPKNLLLQM